DPEDLVDLLELGPRHVAKALPQRARLGLAVLEALERRAALSLERRVLLDPGVEANVEAVERLDVDLSEIEIRAPALPRGDQHAVRRAPIAEEVDPDDAMAEGAIDPDERVPGRRAADVVIGEVLGDVRRAVVDADRLAGAELARQQPAAQRAVDQPRER